MKVSNLVTVDTQELGYVLQGLCLVSDVIRVVNSYVCPQSPPRFMSTRS